MKRWSVTFLAILFCSAAAWSQGQPSAQTGSSEPIYRITVVGRSIKAINYGHREEPTRIGFAGTVLSQKSKGDAWVESKRGAVRVQAKFEKLPPPNRFGPQYLTYVLWAITPDGRATNLGEIVPDADDNAKLQVTSHFQAFGLMVTAEPFYSVAQPSDVVVLENVVRPETIGKVEEVTANTRLLSRRGAYTMDLNAEAPTGGKKLSMDRYEAVVELYQAQNAVQIAQAEGAATYAPDVFAKAQRLFQRAQMDNNTNASPRQIVTTAREAAQAAEDARIVTAMRLDEEQQRREKRAAERAAEQAAVARAQAQAAVEQQASLTPEPEPEPQSEPVEGSGPVIQIRPGPRAPGEMHADLRTDLYQQFSSAFETRQTARGIVLNINDVVFRTNSASLAPSSMDRLSRVAGPLRAHPELKVQVEGYTNGTTDQQLMSNRAAAIVDYLNQQGITAASMTARGLTMHPPAGAPQYRHVEIIVSGGELGGR